MCQNLPQQDDIVRHGHFGDRFPLGSIPPSQGMVISNWFIHATVATSIKFESAFPAIKYLKSGSWVVWIVWFDITRTPFVFFRLVHFLQRLCYTVRLFRRIQVCEHVNFKRSEKQTGLWHDVCMHPVAKGKQWHLCILQRKKQDPFENARHIWCIIFPKTLGIWCDFEVLLNNDGWAGCHWDFHQWIQWILSNRTPWKDAPLCCCPSSSDVIFAASPAICNEARFLYALFVLCYENVVSR